MRYGTWIPVAFIALTMPSSFLPKGDSPLAIKVYRLIFLFHIMGKLISKVLASRLATRISELVHPSKNAFIKGE
jgi:hypothetical protein